MPDIADLYDYEIAEIAKIWKELMDQFSRKENSRANLQELAKVAHDQFLRAGFVVNVQWENSLVMIPNPNVPGGIAPMPITIEVIGRIEGDNVLFDHERKRSEVLLGNERGEAFAGQKERADRPS